MSGGTLVEKLKIPVSLVVTAAVPAATNRVDISKCCLVNKETYLMASRLLIFTSYKTLFSLLIVKGVA